MAIDRNVDVPGWGRYVLSRVGSFDDSHPLSAYSAIRQRGGTEYAPALYVVLAFVPASGQAGVTSSVLDVTDDKGGVLRHGDASATFSGRDLLSRPDRPVALPTGGGG